MVWAVCRAAFLALVFAGLNPSQPAHAQSTELDALNAEVKRLYRAGKYRDAVPIAKQAFEVTQRLHGKDHTSVATTLNNLALLYNKQDRYADAEPLYKRSLAIKEKALGKDHTSVATTLNNLAGLYESQGRYVDAEPLYKRSLAIDEKALGKDHTSVARTLNNLAFLYRQQGRYADAEPLYKRSLAIRETAFGKDHTSVATTLNNLARLYGIQGRYADAEPLYKRSLAIKATALGKDHTSVATTLNNLARLYRQQGRYADAEPLYKRSLAINEKALGKDHTSVARTLNNLAGLYRQQGRNADAELLYKRSLTIKEKALGKDHTSVASTLNNLAVLYESQGRYADAEPLYKRSLAIDEKALGKDHTSVATTLNNLAVLYESQGRYADAEPLYKRSLAIDEKALGKDHTSVARTLNNLAGLYQNHGRQADAEPLYKRSLTIKENALGKDHTSVAKTLNNLAVLHENQGRYGDAEPVYERSLAIRETAFGKDHPSVATTLNNLAELYEKTGRTDEAKVLKARLNAMPAPGTRHIQVHFGTNRSVSRTNNSSDYSGKFSDTLSFGRAVVRIPKSEVGKRAKKIVEGLGRPDQTKGQLSAADALKVMRIEPLAQSTVFKSSATEKLHRSALYKKQALIFVHGYNVDFAEALQRAAQIAFDLEFDGAFFTYSWPSRGKAYNYFTDGYRADKSAKHLVRFIDTLAKDMPDVKLHFIAHSMGNRVLSAALQDIADRTTGAPRPNFGEIILAHADVPAKTCAGLAKARKLVRGVTLYVNADDWALWISKWIRLGKARCGSKAQVYKGIDTIDTTGMGGKADLMALFKGTNHHGVFARDPLLFGEISRLLRTGVRPPAKRTGELANVKNKSGMIYWKYDPALDITAQARTGQPK